MLSRVELGNNYSIKNYNLINITYVHSDLGFSRCICLLRSADLIDENVNYQFRDQFAWIENGGVTSLRIPVHGYTLI